VGLPESVDLTAESSVKGLRDMPSALRELIDEERISWV